MQNAELKKSLPKYSFIKGLDLRPEASSQEVRMFYIGSNPDTLNEYPHSFKSSCLYSDDLKKGIEKLQQIEFCGDMDMQAIFIDTPLHISHLKEFHDYISHSPFQILPVIYIANHLSTEDKKQLSSLRIVDDVIILSKDLFTIRERLQFIGKIKFALYKKDRKVLVEQHFPSICGIRCVTKRAMDILLSSLLLIILAPLLLLIALIIHLDSSGPIFYNSYRAGRGYRIFKFYKFRTMKVGAERMVTSLSHMNRYYKDELPVFFKMENDPRVTRIGTFLRNTSLDELPQLFNVLKGDMSLVGNRPLPLYEASTLTTDEWAERFVAPAGITGLWQIRKRGKAEMSVEERIHLDIAYARHYNLMMDFWIMVQTPRVLLQANNS